MNFIYHINFVANHYYLCVVLSILFNSVDPVLYICKRLFLCNIVHQHYAYCSSVILKRRLTEAILACSVPHLNLHCFVEVLDILFNVVDPCCPNESLDEFSFGVSMHETALPDASVSEHQYLYEIIRLLRL